MLKAHVNHAWEKSKLLVLLTCNQDISILITYPSFTNSMNYNPSAADFPVVVFVVMTVEYGFNSKRLS